MSRLFRNLDNWIFTKRTDVKDHRPALFKVEAVHLASPSNHIEVCTCLVVGDISAKNWDSAEVIWSPCGEEFDRHLSL